MRRHEQQNDTPIKDTAAAYEPPLVEDLDTSQGPVTTPAGTAVKPSNVAAAPRAL